MSAVTIAHDNAVTRIAAVLTSGAGWKRIPNPYDIRSNGAPFLRKGWGLAIGGGNNINLLQCSKMSVDRQFRLVISNEVFKTDGDATGYASIALALLEALKLVIKDFETDTTLNSGQTFVSYVGDQGIESIQGEDYSCMVLTAIFAIKLIEDLIP